MSPRHTASTVTTPPCPLCGGVQARSRPGWRHTCRACGFEYSSLQPAIEASRITAIDERQRQTALRQLRHRNARQVLDTLGSLRPLNSGRLLDVGCAYGWFLEVARERGLDVLGIEPEQAIAEVARASGLPVRDGFFPAAIPATERFDVICFNDVLEHIPGPEQIVAACVERLKPGGLLSVVIPLRTGVFYRAADRLARIGIGGPLDRMWQKSFHSPHVSYFTRTDLERIARRSGLNPVLFRTLPSVARQGLWARLRYDRAANAAVSAIYWAVLAPAVSVVNLLPGDIGHFVFRRDGA